MILKSVTGKSWQLKEADKNKITSISQKFSISESLSRLIVLRNIDNQDVLSFLDPEIDSLLQNKYVLKDLEKGVNFLCDKIITKKTIGIFGDYDVDGASATALLIRFFKNINCKYEFFIPDRNVDGYGPTIESFKKLINKNIDIILTVDCGTQSYEAIDYAKYNEIETIVLDHHQSTTKIPKAISLINPNRYDDFSGLNYLCATGVVFLFLQALIKKLKKINWFESKNINEPNLIDNLDLVALATICDVVPLKGINRSFVKHGLESLKKRKNIGIDKLLNIKDINSTIDTYHLGFLIGPIINAGGRLGFSTYGTKLLSTDNNDEAEKLSITLNDLNEKRKKIELIHLNEVKNVAEKYKNDHVLVLFNNNWNEGIIGILASRIKDIFLKPTIILTNSNGSIKASGRSIEGFNIGQQILNCVEKNIIIKGGGHKMACGFTMNKKNIDLLRESLNTNFKKNNKIKNIIPIDCKINISAINEEFYDDIIKISPFGSENPSPNFLIEDLYVHKSRILKDKHISSLMLSKNGRSINSICFNGVDSGLENYLLSNNKKKINLIGKLSQNIWMGKRKIQFIIKDVVINSK